MPGPPDVIRGVKHFTVSCDRTNGTKAKRLRRVRSAISLDIQRMVADRRNCARCERSGESEIIAIAKKTLQDVKSD